MGENQFKGPIEFKNASSNLLSLDLSGNKFDGPIHKSISKNSNLKFLDLSYNNFIGPIPTLNLVNLTILDLSYNKLEGEIPDLSELMSILVLCHNSINSFGKSFEVSNLTYIDQLDINSNSFQGPLPHWICKLRSLTFLDFSNNSFSGFVPQCLSNIMVFLNGLNLRNNNLSGVRPPNLFVNAVDLHLFDVSNNQIEGKLPESMRGCTSLRFLNVKSNRIKEKFPHWLGFLPLLQVMILRSNEFYGSLYHPHVSIGFESLMIIDISHNDFNGTLPPSYFSNWHTLTEDFGDTYMADHVDPHFKYYIYATSIELVNKGVDTEYERIRRDFRAIDFSGNKFSGQIPESIGFLKELRLLNLSGNSFTSNIPQSLANLTNLEALDLSWNQLSGHIPRNLGSLSFLSFVNFSHNNLEGPIPRGTQFQRQNCSSFMDNPKLYGFEDMCRQTHVPNPTSQEPEDLSEPEEQVISWIAAAIAYGPGVFCGLVIGYIFSPYKHKCKSSVAS